MTVQVKLRSKDGRPVYSCANKNCTRVTDTLYCCEECATDDEGGWLVGGFKHSVTCDLLQEDLA